MAVDTRGAYTYAKKKKINNAAFMAAFLYIPTISIKYLRNDDENVAFFTLFMCVGTGGGGDKLGHTDMPALVG